MDRWIFCDVNKKNKNKNKKKKKRLAKWEAKHLKNPKSMLGSPHGTVFQQYTGGRPQDEFYISCGHAEKRVITFWWCNESDSFRLSTDNKKSFRTFSSFVKVFEINSKLKSELKLKLLYHI